MGFQSLAGLIQESREKNLPLWETVFLADCKERDVEQDSAWNRMRTMYQAMMDANNTYDEKLLSNSKLMGGDGAKIQKAMAENRLYSGSFMGEVMSIAVKTGESNACMKRIVAAPTAGSCGVLPAVLLPTQKERNLSEDEMIKALYVAAGIGDVIAYRASISGAMGGCQAEIGSASAMGAAALVFLAGGDPESIMHGAAMALKNLLGLACDPVAGLVEVPCVKRNVIGAVNAVAAADMAISGVRSRIPPDEVIDAMRMIGDEMPPCLKETGEGGLAITPTGCKIKEALECQN